MFSPERIAYSFIENDDRLFTGLPWKKLFKEFFYILYFKSHLSNHLYSSHKIVICLDKSINLETLNLLHTLSNKYSFIKLRQSEPRNIDTDFEQSYLLSSDMYGSRVLTADTCFLIGVNPRYEGPRLNLILRSRYLKGNFKIIQIGSLLNLTFSTRNLSNNIKYLKSLVEGNNLFCQEFTNSSNPILISNSEIFKRKDSFCLANMIKQLIAHVNFYSNSNISGYLNIISSALNESGFNNFNVLKGIQNSDLESSLGVYFLNSSFCNCNIEKLLNLKLLNFFQGYKTINKILVTQDNNLEIKKVKILKKGFSLSNHIHLPTSVFFETSGAFMDTDGNINKLAKVVTQLNQSKSDWHIIRKIFSYCRKTLFISSFFQNSKLAFNSNRINQFKNFIGFQYYATSNLNGLAFYLLKRVAKPNVPTYKFKPRRSKIYQSQLRF